MWSGVWPACPHSHRKVSEMQVVTESGSKEQTSEHILRYCAVAGGPEKASANHGVTANLKSILRT